MGDISAAAWSDASPMGTARRDFAATVLNNEIYVLGGHDDDGCHLASVERFDPATGLWCIEPSMQTERVGFAAAAMDGEIYAIGGLNSMYDKTSSVERFVPRANA